MDDCTIPLKRCTKCSNQYPATTEYFHKDTKAIDGLRTICVACRSIYSRQYRKENAERRNEYDRRRRKEKAEIIRERKRQYRQVNSEKESASKRLYYAANTERIIAANRRYRAANPDKMRELSQRYRKEHPEKERERHRRRRARKAAVPATFTIEHERLALDYFNGCCAVCGCQLKDLFGTHTVHFDHWIPLSKGGGTTPDNMVPLCGGQNGCNQSKGAKDPVKWLQSQFGKHKARTIFARILTYHEWIKAVDSN